MNRLFLYSGLFFILILIFDAYDRDYNQPENLETRETQSNQGDGGIKPPPIKGKKPAPSISDEKVMPQSIKTVENDKLIIKVDSSSGEIVFAELKEYLVDINAPERIVILDYENKQYSAASSLQILDSIKKPLYLESTTSNGVYAVELISNNVADLKISKTIELKNGTHQVLITNKINNGTDSDVYVRNYETISRSDDYGGSIMLPTFTGAAFYDDENKFLKISFDDILGSEQTFVTTDSWISMIEHYFFTAWLPSSSEKTKTIYTNHKDSVYTIGSTTEYVKVNPGQTKTFVSIMFVGPKLQSEISPLTEGLDLTVDYGMLTFLAAPLFWILDSINFLVKNWGISIILLTFLIKALFFKLSETSYRSMAQMKKLNPRMQALKERYSEDKKKFSEALMRMYKEEKVNPLGGCLPILIQIPVFIALYWVLVESIEIRHAPFIGWIEDLSSADPYFILPIAMGISMYIQQKLNPAPTDATQQKIFLFLPFIFTALFATFPSGLVLYWLTNNILSIAQQYVINKRIVG